MNILARKGARASELQHDMKDGGLLKIEELDSICLNKGWLTPNTYCSREYAPLPDRPGIYKIFGVNNLFSRRHIYRDEIDYVLLYIGKSSNLAKRLSSHEIFDKIVEKFDVLNIYFKEFSIKSLDKVERDLIKKLKPPYNIIHRKRGFS